MTRQVLVYELNEVPWPIVDLYLARRPRSTLGAVLGNARQRTTVNPDPVPLMPWRSWPTFHRSMLTDEHNSFDQGQDPATFRGVPLWDVADRAGKSVGLFGLLQSWPPRTFAHGGFYVPDCFAHDASTVPASVAPFQRFSLEMTTENLFAPTTKVAPRTLARSLPGLVRLGMRPATAAFAAGQLARERIDERYLERRSVVQALVAFDTFWQLHRRTRPDLSMFFSNHVAGILHRFWRDIDPEETKYNEPDPIHADFILTAMDIFDRHLGRLMRWLKSRPNTVLVVASSIGQGPLHWRPMPATYVLEDAARLTTALALPPSERERCMYPRVTLRFDSAARAEAASVPVQSVVNSDGEPVFRDGRVKGRTLSVEVAFGHDTAELPERARWRPLGAATTVEGDVTELGVSIRGRSFGGDSGRHVPTGMLFAVGPGIEPDSSRAAVSTLDAAPSILALLGVDPDPTMQGTPDLFT